MAKPQTKGTNPIERLNVALRYPEEDMIGLVQALAKLLPRGAEDPLVPIGRLNARAVALWKTMHDSGEFQLSLDEGSADARLSGYGHPLRRGARCSAGTCSSSSWSPERPT